MSVDVEKLVAGIHDYLARAFRPVGAQLRALEQRLDTLEQRKGIDYRGTWREGETFERGVFATHQGSLWYCHETTNERPGDSPAWQLCVKHGRDAR